MEFFENRSNEIRIRREPPVVSAFSSASTEASKIYIQIKVYKCSVDLYSNACILLILLVAFTTNRFITVTAV